MGSSIKDVEFFFGHFSYLPPPCQNFDPDLPNFYLLISFNNGIWDTPPPKIFQRILLIAPSLIYLTKIDATQNGYDL